MFALRQATSLSSRLSRSQVGVLSCSQQWSSSRWMTTASRRDPSSDGGEEEAADSVQPLLSRPHHIPIYSIPDIRCSTMIVGPLDYYYTDGDDLEAVIEGLDMTDRMTDPLGWLDEQLGQLSLSSTLKKRRQKMNKHKLRKRRKRERRKSKHRKRL